MLRALLPLLSDTVLDSLVLAPYSIFLQTVWFLGEFANKAFVVIDQLPQFALVLARDITGLEQPMLEKVGDPFHILYISFRPGLVFI